MSKYEEDNSLYNDGEDRKPKLLILLGAIIIIVIILVLVISCGMKTKSSNNYLSYLKVNNATLTPAFDKNTTVYSLTTKEDVVAISCASESAKATTSGCNKRITLYDKSLTHTITVIAEDKGVRTYKISITKEEGSETPVVQITSTIDNNNTQKVKEAVLTSYVLPSDSVVTYQWYKNDSAISNATSSSYTTPTLYIEDSGNKYHCIVRHTKTGKTAKSRVATITVLGYKPTSTNPVNTKVNNGDNVDFTVKITVGNPVSTICQWQISSDDGNTYENIGTETTLTESDYTTLSLLAVSYAEYNGTKFRISATNTEGTHYSSAATLTINRKPNEPTLIFPKPNTTTYNKKPFGLFQWGTDLDGDSMLGYIAIDGIIYRSDSNSWYNGGPKTTAERSLVKFDKNRFTNNHYDITAYTNDGMIDSNYVNSNITISDPNFTDTIQRNVPIKAIHISELRSKINDLENYYGLDITNWSDTITSGSTIKSIHIEELRTAIDTIKTYLNSFGANISISWTDSSLKDKLIKAVHINEIRDAITKL